MAKTGRKQTVLQKSSGRAAHRKDRDVEAARNRDDEACANLKALTEANDAFESIRSGPMIATAVHNGGSSQVFPVRGDEQTYRVLIDTMSEGVATIDARGRVMYANPRLAEILSTPLENIVGACFRDFVNVSSKVAFSRYFKKASQNRASAEILLNTAKGRQLAVLLSSNPLEPDAKGICVVVTDITSCKLAEEATSRLAKQVLLAQEQERQRVARELHDSVSQLLSTTRHRAQGLAAHLKAAGRDSQARVEELMQLLERTMREVRLISRNLRPSELDDLGLLSALSSLVEETTERTGINVQLIAPKIPFGLSPELELTIYRVAQEALSNVEKHSRARSATLSLVRRGKFLVMAIQDDGKSFAPKRTGRSGWGLLNMRERASHVDGTLEIEPRPGKGTAIVFRVPI